MQVADALPINTFISRFFAATLAGRIVDVVRAAAGTTGAADVTDDRQAILAMPLNNLGNCLGELGRREDALNAANEATDIYRRLAAARPDAFLPTSQRRSTTSAHS